MPQDARADALRALSLFLVTDASLGDTLLRVAEVATAGIPAAEFAGIAMLDAEGRATTAVFTDQESPELDKAQYSSGRGPCLDAWRQKRTVRIDDLQQAKDRYPEFCEAALNSGIASTLSLGLTAGGAGLGALNLYARNTNAFTDEDAELGEEVAATAAAVLANATAYWSAFELSEGLSEAMKSRAVIEQAKGILMARSPTLDADGAFDLLRRASQRENVKLRDVALRIVERQQPPPVAGA